MTIKTRKVNVKIANPDGSIIFEKPEFEVPDDWSDRAATIVASKYAMDNENSAVDIIERVAKQITKWGVEQGYFNKTKEAALIVADKFYFDLSDILINQRAAFNSPVWFNCGSDTGTNQMSACFIVPVEDTMESILEHNTIEGEIFRGGSGAGCNVSPVRAKGEKLSNKGTASGPLSFMKMWDATAGVIRSGGKVRRAAKMIEMNADHPDIMDFIECKLKEEKKAKELIKAEISPEEAYDTVAFQNTNHSIRVENDFMKAAINNKKWCLINRGNPDQFVEVEAKDILNRAAEVAWETGDPGIQFDDRMNIDNPVPENGLINGTNPCLTADMELLTNKGYIPIGELTNKEVTLINKDGNKTKGKVWSNGVKDICEIKFHWKTELEDLRCTPDHRWMLIDGTECEAKDLKGKRLMPQEASVDMGKDLTLDKNAFLAGFVQGNGNPQILKSRKDKKVEVYFGEKDKDVAVLFEQPVSTWYSKWAAQVTKDFKIQQVPLPERELPHEIASGLRNETKTNFLSGLFSANGCVIKNTRVALKTTCKNLALNLKTILHHNYGIESYITTNKLHRNMFKNGEYNCKESYELNIYKYADLIKFYHTFWFAQEYKRKALLNTIVKRSPTISAVVDTGQEEVFDFNEPETHWGIVNGFVCHNCSEFSAIDNSSCNLVSLNLLKYYEKEEFDFSLFKEDIKILITAMDILIDAADYPTEDIKRVTQATRPLGLGFSNLGALLMIKGLPYDSEEARAYAKGITKKMTTFAYEQSHELAKKLGTYEYYKENKIINYDLICRLTEDEDLGNTIHDGDGLRNSQVTLLAPTGTISFLMDCDTTGIEPLFALQTVKTLAGGGTMMIDYPCVEKAFSKLERPSAELFPDNPDPRDFVAKTGIERLPEKQKKIFQTANEITWKAHIDMMAACQQHLNGAISKTVNMQADATVEDIKNAYVYAWEKDLKCLAIYRDGCKDMQPMKDAKQNKEKEAKVASSIIPSVKESSRLKPTLERNSITLKIDIAGHEGYCTAGMYPDGSLCEIFVRMSKEGSMVSGLMDAFATSISLGLQHGVPLQHLVEKFKNTSFMPNGITGNIEIPMVSSIIDYIFRWLELRFLTDNIDEDDSEELDEYTEVETPVQSKNVKYNFDGPPCTDCGSVTSKVGTCYLCNVCGTTSGCS